MQLVQELPDFDFVLRGADGDWALVNDTRLESSFILTPERLIEDWPPRRLAELDAAAIEPLLALQPDVILLGVGAVQAFPASEVIAACLGRGIGIECMTNASAARTFNVLAGEGRKVAAGFLLGGTP
ncbi:Mth938-like domain-containing protein [Luteimonas sp. e5]